MLTYDLFVDRSDHVAQWIRGRVALTARAMMKIQLMKFFHKYEHTLSQTMLVNKISYSCQLEAIDM